MLCHIILYINKSNTAHVEVHARKSIFSDVKSGLISNQRKRLLKIQAEKERAEKEILDKERKGNESEKQRSIPYAIPQPPPLPPIRKRNDYFEKAPEDHIRVFFNVPIVKFWTSTLFYLGFLILQAYP